jgi:hypothetical protein
MALVGSLAFHDERLEADFARQGYVVTPLLDSGEVRALRAAYERLHVPGAKGFHASMHFAERGYREAVFETVARALDGPVRRRLPGHRLRIANFVVKEPSAPESLVPLHQDFSFVDETVFRTVLVWCPLVDVGADNGCLGIVPGSHRLPGAFRACDDPHPFKGILRPLLDGYLRKLPMRAGDAVFYDGRLLHGSRPNQTPERRVTAACVLTPPEAPLLHGHRISPTDVEQFAVDEAFFRRFTLGARPSGVARLGVVSSPLRQHTVDVLDQLERA